MESACSSLHFRGLKVTSLTKINKGSLLWLIGCRNSKETVCNTEFILPVSLPTQPQTGWQSCTLTCTFTWQPDVFCLPRDQTQPHTVYSHFRKEKSWYLFDNSGFGNFCRETWERNQDEETLNMYKSYFPGMIFKRPCFYILARHQQLPRYFTSHHDHCRFFSGLNKAILPSDLCLVVIGKKI